MEKIFVVFKILWAIFIRVIAGVVLVILVGILGIIYILEQIKIFLEDVL